MKKSLLILATCFLFASCAKEETMGVSPQPDKEGVAPSIYGMAMLKDVPATRGVANKTKIWNNTMVKGDLTVKFLNGSSDYQNLVKTIAQEWEKVADVRFHFLTDNTQEAMIRIGFDYVAGMQSSWSYTGTDHLWLIDDQTEPTMHFARWRRVSDECKRSDVLRAFGQVLGLELEYRHPECYPTWKLTPEGTIDEAYIRAYWESELGGLISWDELKTMVLDPINVSARFIAKTEDYDPHSVMCWPFYERLAGNLDPISYDSDYNTELSALDISFIQSLYGEAPGPRPLPHDFLPLIEFNYTGEMPSFTVTTTKNLGVKWDAKVDDAAIERYDLPSGKTTNTWTISHQYQDTTKRKIVIGEMLDNAYQLPSSSSALQLFDFTAATGADSILIKPYNQSLETVWIRGGKDFIPQNFNFKDNINLKNLYLIQTGESTVNVENCKNLEILSNTPSIYNPAFVIKPSSASESLIIGSDSLQKSWPDFPMEYLSIKSVNITGCDNLTTVSLDYTGVNHISLAENYKLEVVYLSTLLNSNSIAGGGYPKGKKLLEVINSLPSRANDFEGVIIFRGIDLFLVPGEAEEPGGEIIQMMYEARYDKITIDKGLFHQASSIAASKNWRLIWDSGYTLIN